MAELAVRTGGGALAYRVGQFTEPLDVLWALVHENRINIYDIPVAELAEQFLNWLDQAAEADLQDLSEFYVWAAKLLCMKSRMMLPSDVSLDGDDDFDDPRGELVELLIEYQMAKKRSQLLEMREEQSEWTFERKKIRRIIPKDGDFWEEADAESLLLEMQRMFKSMATAYSDERILDMYEEISVNEKITLMNEFLERDGECLFSALVTRRGSVLDIVCAFMAVLEAVKFNMASIFQNKIFGDIRICRPKAA